MFRSQLKLFAVVATVLGVSQQICHAQTSPNFGSSNVYRYSRPSNKSPRRATNGRTVLHRSRSGGRVAPYNPQVYRSLQARGSGYSQYFHRHNRGTTRGYNQQGAMIYHGGSGGRYATPSRQATQVRQGTQARHYIQPDYRRPTFNYRR